MAHMGNSLDQSAYVQVADVPAQHRPGSGELNYKFVFEELRHMGYKGPVGLECWPEQNGKQQTIADIVALRR